MKTWKSAACVLLLMSCAGTNSLRETANDEANHLVVVSPKLDQAPEPHGGLAAIQAAVRSPEEVIKQNKSAIVWVEAVIDINGRVAGTKIAKSSGFENLDAAAMLAVARVVWKPGRKKGEPRAATVRVPIRFGMAE